MGEKANQSQALDARTLSGDSGPAPVSAGFEPIECPNGRPARIRRRLTPEQVLILRRRMEQAGMASGVPEHPTAEQWTLLAHLARIGLVGTENNLLMYPGANGLTQMQVAPRVKVRAIAERVIALNELAIEQ